MKQKVRLLIIAAGSLLLAGCGNKELEASQQQASLEACQTVSDYQKLYQEHQQLQSQYDQISSENESLQDALTIAESRAAELPQEQPETTEQQLEAVESEVEEVQFGPSKNKVYGGLDDPGVRAVSTAIYINETDQVWYLIEDQRIAAVEIAAGEMTEVELQKRAEAYMEADIELLEAESDQYQIYGSASIEKRYLVRLLTTADTGEISAILVVREDRYEELKDGISKNNGS